MHLPTGFNSNLILNHKAATWRQTIWFNHLSFRWNDLLGLGNYAQNALRIHNRTLTLNQSMNFYIIETDLKKWDVCSVLPSRRNDVRIFQISFSKCYISIAESLSLWSTVLFLVSVSWFGTQATLNSVSHLSAQQGNSFIFPDCLPYHLSFTYKKKQVRNKWLLICLLHVFFPPSPSDSPLFATYISQP